EVAVGQDAPLRAAGPGSGGPAASDVWSALGGELKAGIDLRVLAPLAGERLPAGPPVTEGLVMKAAPHLNGGEDDPGRRLRYDGATDPGGQGFAAPRGRRLPPGRRRRGNTAR
ncbi:DUF4255 domain-containing protein, partial [Streptomyces californicus]